MLLWIIAIFGLVVPNGFFVHWLATDFHGLRPIWDDRLAMGFIIDTAMALAILAYYFARRPIGPVRWPAFVALSLLGGLGFSLPVYWWLNTRRTVSA
jgi:hypothetical protein